MNLREFFSGEKCSCWLSLSASSSSVESSTRLDGSFYTQFCGNCTATVRQQPLYDSSQRPALIGCRSRRRRWARTMKTVKGVQEGKGKEEERRGEG